MSSIAPTIPAPRPERAPLDVTRLRSQLDALRVELARHGNAVSAEVYRREIGALVDGVRTPAGWAPFDAARRTALATVDRSITDAVALFDAADLALARIAEMGG